MLTNPPVPYEFCVGVQLHRSICGTNVDKDIYISLSHTSVGKSGLKVQRYEGDQQLARKLARARYAGHRLGLTGQHTKAKNLTRTRTRTCLSNLTSK